MNYPPIQIREDGRLATAGNDPLFDNQTSIGYDSNDDKTSILHNWDEYGVGDMDFVRRLYNEAIKEVLKIHGGFPEVKLSNIPNYRTSKLSLLKKVPKEHELQMVPKMPENFLAAEVNGQSFDKSKINAGYLNEKKQKRIYQMINQTLNGLSDEDHKQKYYAYLVTQGITIVSDIFERMDMDRKIIESLRKLQAMDHLSEEEFLDKKKILMRKLT